MLPTSTVLPPFPPIASTRRGRASGTWAGFPSRPGTTPRTYLGKGVFYSPVKWLQVWGGLIAVYTDSSVKSDSLELRPFGGPRDRRIEHAEVALLQLHALRSTVHRDPRHGYVEDRAPGPQPDPHRNPPCPGRSRVDAEVVVPAGRRRAHLPLRHRADRSPPSARRTRPGRQPADARGVPLLRPVPRARTAAGSRTRTTSSA